MYKHAVSSLSGLYLSIKLLGMRVPKLRELIRLAGVHKQVAAA